MNVHVSYKIPKTPEIEKELNHLIAKLQNRLQLFRPELIHLKGTIEQNSAREGLTISLNLRLPSGQMAVHESASNATATIKAAGEELLSQLNKHKDLLRSTHKWYRRGTNSDHASAQVPFEQTLASTPVPTVRPDDVCSYVNANLSRLELFIERELYFREAAEQLPPNAVSKEEVIDEAIARALQDGDKPELLSLEPWLYRLALRSIDDLARRDGDGSASVPLEESADQPNVRGSDELALQFHQPDEMLTEEDVIADRRAATPEDIASADEMIALVQSALSGSKPADREALILHAIGGFTIEEIAAITDRRSDEVRSSITAARKQVRAVSPITDRFRERAQQSTSAD